MTADLVERLAVLFVLIVVAPVMVLLPMLAIDGRLPKLRLRRRYQVLAISKNGVRNMLPHSIEKSEATEICNTMTAEAEAGTTYVVVKES